MSSSIQLVRFQDDELQAVRGEDDQVFVVVKRVCEALGIDDASQRKRLSDPERTPWACGVMMTSHDSSGRRQELFCLDIESIPLWLATIDVNRVAEHVRPKLVRYQRECARVLRDHFFGKKPANTNGALVADTAYDIGMRVLVAAGVTQGVAAACVLRAVEENTGVCLDAVRKALPSTTEPTGVLNATRVGELLGDVKAAQVNRMLARLGLQEKRGKEWVLTEAGKVHGEAYPFARNGHTAHQIRWKPSVIEALKKLTPLRLVTSTEDGQ